MLEKHRHLLIQYRNHIASDLLVDDILAYLQSKLVLDSDDKELIRTQTTSKRRAEKLLDILPTKGFDVFEHFYRILGDKYPHLTELLKSGVSDEVYGDTLDAVDSPAQLQQMTALHHRMVTVNRVEIVEDLLVDDVLNQLQSKFVFDADDVEQIKTEKTSKRQAERLLDLLLNKSDAAFDHFKEALYDTYPHLAELLEGDKLLATRKIPDAMELQEKVENILSEGGVPQRPDVFTNRARDVHKVRTALQSLNDHDGWVILHGMAGCGKTVLAAEALRSPLLLDQCFPGGIYWIRIGQVSQCKILMQMQNLCARLDNDHTRSPPRNVEEAKDRLRMLFAHQHPRSLLVLDDLWNASDVRYFDIRCRILVTTRDASITNSVVGSKVKVHVSEGFTDKEALQILSLWTRTVDLPPEANKIVDLCKGSPLAISMIGALLKEHPTRWKYYLNQFEKKKVSKLKTNFAYEYPTLSEAILMSINNLSDELRGYYTDFALFDDESKIPAQVLCILWDEEFEIVEDLMDELVNKSLARKSVQALNVQGVCYSIHNLQLTYLQELTTDTVVLHKKLIDRYREVYEGKFDRMTDDRYIHWNLIRHMLKGNMVEDAFSLITDLSWVVCKLKVTGPADLISDYISVRNKITDKDLETLDNFHHFVSTNAHLFVAKTMPDIVQLALQEPSPSEVYKQAKTQAVKLAKDGRLYVEWCNQKSDTLESRLLITAKVHSGAVHSCKFSKDATKVVSCSTDNTVKVWESQSGKELLSLVRHGDVVNCCCFSHDGTHIISCSADQTVRIWDGVSGGELLCFVGHIQEVFCCAFSPDDSKALSCSADRTVKVWNSKTGIVSQVYTNHTDIVRWCSYSPDGTKVASCSDDTTVRVWEANTGRDLCIVEDHTNSLSFCCFMNGGDSVVAVSNNYVKVWNSSSGEQTWNFNASSTCLSLAFSPDDSIVAMGFSDTTVQLWNSRTYTSLGVYRGHTGWVHSVSISDDSCKLVSGSEDETVKIWTIDRNATKDVINLRRVFDAFFGKDSLLVAVADSSDRLLVYEGEDGSMAAEGDPMDGKITSISFSPSGQAIAVGCDNGAVSILNRSCKVLQSFSEHQGQVRRCAFNQDGQLLVSASDDKTAKVYDLSNGSLALSLVGHTDTLKRCVFYNNDLRILTASLDGSLKVWNARSGGLEFTCCHSSKDYVLTCEVFHDSKRLISASADCFAKVWDANTGALLHSLGPHPDVVRSVSLSPDNRFICTGCDDGIIRIWDSVEGKELASCTKHDRWIAECHFTNDSQTIVSISDNIQWWSRDGKRIQEFHIKGGFAKDIKCSTDFRRFVTVDDTATLYILKQVVP